jgi:hypothetical protein
MTSLSNYRLLSRLGELRMLLTKLRMFINSEHVQQDGGGVQEIQSLVDKA